MPLATKVAKSPTSLLTGLLHARSQLLEAGRPWRAGRPRVQAHGGPEPGAAAAVARVQEDGWEKAAAASIWSALVSEGFYLMKSANKMLLSKAGDAGGAQALAGSRLSATAALLVAIARFEAVRRLFGGRCYNSDLARNTGVKHCCRRARRLPASTCRARAPVS